MRINILGDRSATEASAAQFTAEFYDNAWATTTPTSIRYRVDDVRSGAELAGWTAVTPATSVTITVTAAQNAIVDDVNNTERRLLTVQADNALASQVTAAFVFELINLRSVS